MSRRVSLALQGGGAHGAFTWGALDRILAEPDLEIAAISGTSAGALNAAALVSGLMTDGVEGARAALERLWRRVGELGDLRFEPWMSGVSPAMRLWQQASQSMIPFSPAALMAQVYSPYAWGERWQNPLANILEDIDFGAIRRADAPKLFIGATNVRSGKIKIFASPNINAQIIMASACLPTVFQAVEIDGEAYWDGGYAGNPSLWPLFDRALPDDLLLVQVNPLRRDDIPQTPNDIHNRTSEISFNASLMSELRAIAFVKRLIAEGRVERSQMKDLRVHMIADDILMNALSATTKLQPGGGLVERLYHAGYRAAESFFADHGGQIGHASSIDLAAILL